MIAVLFIGLVIYRVPVVIEKQKTEEAIDYQYLHNPPHLGGVGDIAKSIYQGVLILAWFSIFNRDKILA